MISDELLSTFIQVAGVYISGIVGFLGIVFNVINIIVFVKLGFSDTTNISLLALSVADIGVSLPVLGYSIISIPFVTSLLGRSLAGAIIYAVGAPVHILFCRIAGLLTAFLALERFVCVAWPLRVKTVVTPRLTVGLVISLFVIMTACNVPNSLAYRIGLEFDPLLNETGYGILFHPHGDQLQDITITVQVLAQITSFTVVAVSTLGLVWSLRKSVKWRKSTSAVSLPAHVSRREKQLVKMVILISVVFIVCSLPTVVGNLAMVCDKDFNVRGSLMNLFLFSSIVFFILNTTNSMVNMFVYLNMSSRYRVVFLSLISRT
ncbi:unnamed protein product [Lymnaea stagnalis]|uniref:G-protein coupled receptors family 1 profile domain-containing protein n=1 Tax=Lymnaea stagnalis TaxID=6523 RepID=A0AAV2HVW4_LYMST